MRHCSLKKTCVQQCEFSRPSVKDSHSSLSALRDRNETKFSCNAATVDSSAAHRVALSEESRQLTPTNQTQHFINNSA